MKLERRVPGRANTNVSKLYWGPVRCANSLMRDLVSQGMAEPLKSQVQIEWSRHDEVLNRVIGENGLFHGIDSSVVESSRD